MTTPTSWNPFQKIIFRFFASYFILYILITQNEVFPLPGLSILFTWMNAHMWMPLTDFTGKLFWHLQDIPSGPNGSGDTTRDYVLLFVICLLSFFLTALWSVLDRKRRQYNVALYWTMVLVRYTLATAMVVYGTVKIIKLQFPEPSLFRLLEPYGKSSPMGLAWTFMGYSRVYCQYIGWSEFIAGILLFFRRTKTLGALFAVVVCMNIVAVNFCFDVCVKLYSSNLLLMAIFITIPEIAILYRFFILHQPVALRFKDRPFRLKKWQKILGVTLKFLFIGTLLFSNITDAMEQSKTRGEKASKPPLWGIYNAEVFVLNKDTLPPLTTDSIRWKRMVISGTGFLHLYSMNDDVKGWESEIDTSNHSISMNRKSKLAYLNYSVPDAEHLACKGYYEKDSLYIVFKKENTDSFLLKNRGFHWINETPYNR